MTFVLKIYVSHMQALKSHIQLKKRLNSKKVIKLYHFIKTPLGCSEIYATVIKRI